jgi:hypothetical protein
LTVRALFAVAVAMRVSWLAGEKRQGPVSCRPGMVGFSHCEAAFVKKKLGGY